MKKLFLIFAVLIISFSVLGATKTIHDFDNLTPMADGDEFVVWDLAPGNTKRVSKSTLFTDPTFTGTVTIPTPFTLGAVSVLPTGTELNYVDGVTSSIQTQLNSLLDIYNIKSGGGRFNSTTGREIVFATPLDDSDYNMLIIQATQGLDVGEISIESKDEFGFTIKNSGLNTTALFEYYTVPYVLGGTTLQESTDTFNSTTGVTVNLSPNLDDTDYNVLITMPSQTNIENIGAISIESKAVGSFVVKNSGADAVTTFNWIAVPYTTGEDVAPEGSDDFEGATGATVTIGETLNHINYYALITVGSQTNAEDVGVISIDNKTRTTFDVTNSGLGTMTFKWRIFYGTATSGMFKTTYDTDFDNDIDPGAGGLGANVSAYDGLLKMSGGSVSEVTDSSTNWDTGYSERRQWDGGSTNLVAATGRTSLGLAIGSNIQAYDADLDALAALSGTGLLARTGAATYSERTITGDANEITVTNGDGVSGNPTLSIDLGKDLVTTAPLTGGVNNILVGADSDVTIALTVLKDIVAGTGLTGGADDVLPGSDADVTITHSTANGYKHIPATGSSAQLLQYSSEGTAKWVTVSSDVTIADGGAVTIGSDKVHDSMIDWGTSATQVSAVDVPIADGGSIITATDVENALQENRTAIDLNTGASGMIYPGAGIALSTGSAWSTSITNNSANWNTAYSERYDWDGGSDNLVAATGRTSLGLGSAALRAAEDTLTDGSNLPDGAAIKTYGDANWSGGAGLTRVFDAGTYSGTDQQKIQQAIDAAEVAGGIAYVPSGTWTVAGLTVTASIVIQGAGAGTILSVSASQQGINVNTTQPVTFKDFNMSLGASATGIYVTGSNTGSNFQNIYITGGAYGMYFHTALVYTVVGCWMDNQTVACAYVGNAVNSDAGDGQFMGCRFFSHTGGVVSGIYWISGGGLKISTCKFDVEGTGSGLYMNASLNNSTGVIKVTGNSFEGECRSAIRIVNSSNSYYLYDIQITGNELLMGVELTGPSGYPQNLRDIVISGNLIGGTPTINGGVVVTAASDINIAGNAFSDIRGAYYGIVVNAAGGATRVYEGANSFKDYTANYGGPFAGHLSY